MSPFIVLKFGGTSVASRARWETIGQIAGARIAEGLKPVIVCSAVSGVSNSLLALIEKVARGEEFAAELASVQEVHLALARDLAVSPLVIESDLNTLKEIFSSAARGQHQQMIPQEQAQVLAMGEILATRLGTAFLAQQAARVVWQDARLCLQSNDERHLNEQRQYLSAACGHDKDEDLQKRFAALPADIILTQGFIAHNTSNETVLLGRGGSDTSAAYFAAKLGAVRCEIWTDVPGLYTANPREIKAARILYQLDYDEAQEMATMGAKVLHPRCIAPVKKARIPLHIRCTNAPDLPGTVISEIASSAMSRVKCISTKTNVTLVSIESLGMWQEVGFLADLFNVFKELGLSIDLISTSETNVTVSIDALANALVPATLDALAKELSQFGKVKLLAPCSAISLVGRNIRSILHQLGPAFRVFEEQKVYLVSQAASDLNLSFVVQEKEATRLVQELHNLLFDNAGTDPAFGPSWQDTFERREPVFNEEKQFWWQQKAHELVDLAQSASPLYVYDAKTLRKSAAQLQSLNSIDQVFYAVKANDNAEVLKTFYHLGLGFECVSVFELDHVFGLFPEIEPSRVLFTPNFAPKSEYIEAFKRKCNVTLDNLFVLEKWPELFDSQNVILRLDPGKGLGHHKHVQTAGEQSKFGISQHELKRAAKLVEQCNATVIGLHAHAGSGITKPSHWVDMANFLINASEHFPDVRVLNLGGGLYVPSQMHDEALDLTKFDEALLRLRSGHKKFEFWLEPGRFLVADCGVLLARVTQLKEKGGTRFVGVDAGMNALIRPALYGAYHHIVNLTRLNHPVELTAHVVGPICESGDTLGYDRKLPKTYEGDVMLIATAGAYGRVMSSKYNRRPFVRELLLVETQIP